MNPERAAWSAGEQRNPSSFLASASAAESAAGSAAVNRLLTEIQSPDESVRGAAWQGAAPLGAPAVKPLATLMSHSNPEIARAAKRALWKIVRHAGRPKAGKERAAVLSELSLLFPLMAVPALRDVIWMVSEIGDETVTKPVAALLENPEIREDARCALERIPGGKATRELEKALRTAPEGFQPALAHSLRVRGQQRRAAAR